MFESVLCYGYLRACDGLKNELMKSNLLCTTFIECDEHEFHANLSLRHILFHEIKRDARTSLHGIHVHHIQ